MNISKLIKFQRPDTATAAGTTDVTSDAVDTAGYESCCFIVAFGTITSGAVTSIKVQQSSDDGVADAYSDLEGTSVTVADTESDKCSYVEVYQPQKRYLKLVVDRGTQNAVIDGIFALLSGGLVAPVSHHSTISGGEFHQSPDEGTA